jgi:hypothetical protein
VTKYCPYWKENLVSIQIDLLDLNADVYPSYSNIRAVKQCCYPSKELFTVTDTLAEVKLWDLLDHTILHIVQAHEIVLTSVTGKHFQKIVSVFKLGFALDTVSTNKDSPVNSDSDLFLTLLVPVQLSTSSSTKEKIVL